MEVVARVSHRRGGPHRGEAQWRALVSKQAASGLSVTTFCAEEAVTRSSFQRWRRRLQGEGGSAGSAAAGFLDLGALGVPAGDGRFELTLDLGGGVVLRLARG